MRVGAGGADGLTISWDATSTDDVSSWMVCWAGAQSIVDTDFSGLVGTFQQTGASCAQSADTTTSLTMTQTEMCGVADCNSVLFFGISGVDAVGNVAAPGASHVEDMADGLDIPDPEDPEPEDPKSDDAPQKAMYAIIALVVLAVIGGAFILTRGGGEEGGDKEWDY